MSKIKDNPWAIEILEQATFYLRSTSRPRKDPYFPWKIIPNSNAILFAGGVYAALKGNRKRIFEWFFENAQHLWKVRSIFADEISKTQFDQAIVIRLVGHNKYFFHRLHFDEILKIKNKSNFQHPELPSSYIGLDINKFNISCDLGNSTNFNLVATHEFVQGINYYRQYLTARNGVNFSPKIGDHVLDCGACIGDFSILFSALVHPHGSVHAFDPVPLHTKFIRHQAMLNPELSNILKTVELAVSNETRFIETNKVELNKISPGNSLGELFSSTTIDSYVSNNLDTVHYIKMDIEGSELDAIEGAKETIKNHKPKLAISTYHKPDHMWQIPLEILRINPDYSIYFEHHSPLKWESVIYAV